MKLAILVLLIPTLVFGQGFGAVKKKKKKPLPKASLMECYAAKDDPKIWDQLQANCERFYKYGPVDQSCKLKLPYQVTGCQGPDCECRLGYSLGTDTEMRSEPNGRIKAFEPLTQGTRFKARKLFTITTVLGRAIYPLPIPPPVEPEINDADLDADPNAEKPEPPKHPAVIRHLVSFVDEGVYNMCLGDKIEKLDPSVGAIIFAEPGTEEWAQVTLTDGRTGWVSAQALVSTDEKDCNFDAPKPEDLKAPPSAKSVQKKPAVKSKKVAPKKKS